MANDTLIIQEWLGPHGATYFIIFWPIIIGIVAFVLRSYWHRIETDALHIPSLLINFKLTNDKHELTVIPPTESNAYGTNKTEWYIASENKPKWMRLSSDNYGQSIGRLDYSNQICGPWYPEDILQDMKKTISEYIEMNITLDAEPTQIVVFKFRILDSKNYWHNYCQAFRHQMSEVANGCGWFKKGNQIEWTENLIANFSRRGQWRRSVNHILKIAKESHKNGS